MQQDQPSTTAEGAARLRAAHQLFDSPRVLDDPIVLRLLGPGVETALQAERQRLEEPALRSLRASMAMRSRYAEDCLREAVARGVRQYVVLGAGLDSFAYRNPFERSALHVYEVDHPATQAWKRRRLADTGIALPSSLSFVPVDFEQQMVSDALRSGGFDRAQPAFVSWLGVTVYLTHAAIMRTLADVASLARGTEIVFGYVTSLEELSAARRAAVYAVAERAAAAGEPWRTFFEPAALAREVEQLGFTVVEDFGPEQAFERYFRGRSDGLRSGGVGRLMRARLGP